MIGITVPSEVLSVDVEHSAKSRRRVSAVRGSPLLSAEVLLINSSLDPITVPARTSLAQRTASSSKP